MFFGDNLIFPGSAAVAQLAVNQLVVGSNPTPGASNFWVCLDDVNRLKQAKKQRTQFILSSFVIVKDVKIGVNREDY